MMKSRTMTIHTIHASMRPRPTNASMAADDRICPQEGRGTSPARDRAELAGAHPSYSR